jgi:hypothetical protein
MDHPSRPPVPPDDDPHFAAWLREIGPLPDDLGDLDTPVEVGRPVAVVIALLAALLGFGIALGIATALAFNALTSLPIALAFMIGATVVTAGALLYLVWRVP